VGLLAGLYWQFFIFGRDKMVDYQAEVIIIGGGATGA